MKTYEGKTAVEWFAEGRKSRSSKPVQLVQTPVKDGQALHFFNEGVRQANAEASEHPGVKKYDVGKAPIGRGFLARFPRALRQVALVSEYGARKYSTYDGWEKLPDAFERYNDGHGRHDNARYIEGEYDDGDSGLPHLAQRAWNALATLELALRNGMIEERRGNDIGEDGKPLLGSNMATKAK